MPKSSAVAPAPQQAGPAAVSQPAAAAHRGAGDAPADPRLSAAASASAAAPAPASGTGPGGATALPHPGLPPWRQAGMPGDAGAGTVRPTRALLPPNQDMAAALATLSAAAFHPRPL